MTFKLSCLRHHRHASAASPLTLSSTSLLHQATLQDILNPSPSSLPHHTYTSDKHTKHHIQHHSRFFHHLLTITIPYRRYVSAMYRRRSGFSSLSCSWLSLASQIVSLLFLRIVTERILLLPICSFMLGSNYWFL